MHSARFLFPLCSFCCVFADHKFASAGREDIDVRMLGNGKLKLRNVSLNLFPRAHFPLVSIKNVDSGRPGLRSLILVG